MHSRRDLIIIGGLNGLGQTNGPSEVTVPAVCRQLNSAGILKPPTNQKSARLFPELPERDGSTMFTG